MKKIMRKIKWMIAGTNSKPGAVYALALSLDMDKPTAINLAAQFTE